MRRWPPSPKPVLTGDHVLLTLIRHGEVEGRSLVFRGRSDPPLSSQGWTQLERAFTALEAEPPELLITSPRVRCHAFAGAWSKVRAIPLRVAKDFAEIDFGDWEELSPVEAELRDPLTYAAFQTSTETWCSPNGESYRAFQSRVLAGFSSLSRVRHTALLTHAGVIRVLIGEVLGINAMRALRVCIPCGATCRIWYDGSRSQLLSLQPVAA